MKKKIIYMFTLVFILLALLCGCNSSKNSDDNVENTQEHEDVIFDKETDFDDLEKDNFLDDEQSDYYADEETDNLYTGVESDKPSTNTETSKPSTNTETSKPSTSTETSKPSTSTETPKPIETPPAELEGVLIDKLIYGCGNEHTQVIKDVTFHWYDRYERRDSKNTKVIEYMDIISFSMHYEVFELSPSWSNNEWVVTYEVNTTSTVTFRWKTYDKDGYYLEDALTGMYQLNGSSITGGWIDGKCRGESKVTGQLLGTSTSYAEFYPYGL